MTKPLLISLAASAVLLAGCGSSTPNPAPVARVAHRQPAAPRVALLPLDDANLHALAPGTYRTQPGFQVPMRFTITGAGWRGAHRSDFSWHLELGPEGDDQNRYLEVGMPFVDAATAARAVTKLHGLQVHDVHRSRLGGRAAFTVTATALRPTAVSTQIVGGSGDMQLTRGERLGFHFVEVGSDTVMVLEGGISRVGDALLRRTLASIHFG